MNETKLPESPNEMPSDLWNSENWLRNTVCSLDQFRSVEIVYERDRAATDREGEYVGTWEVSLVTDSGKPVTCRHEDVLNALWYAVEIAENLDSERYQQREQARTAALAKLSDEERRVLGLRIP